MPILVSSSTPVVPEVVARAAPRFVSLDLVWHGADGSEWHITDPASQVRLMPGMRGLDAVEVDRWTSDAPGLDGNRYRGHRTPSREVFLPVQVRGVSSDDWLAIRRAWDHSLSPDDEGYLEAVVAGGRRTLPCRWVKTESASSRDPLLAGKTVTGEYLEAAGSHWLGETIVRGWTSDAPANFFLDSGGVFWISPSNTLGSATIDNPGDVAAWPVWTVTGPCDDAVLGLAGSLIEVPFSLEADEWLRVDTRPDRQTVEDHTGADRVEDLGAVAFAPIPKGSSVDLTITASATGAGFGVTAELTPLYRRAW